MAKKCKKIGCERPVFSHGYCKIHQYLRTDKKKPVNKLRYRSKTNSSPPDFGFDNQLKLFHYLWAINRNVKGEVFCKYTGEKLNKFIDTPSLWYSCFMHILPKGKYTYFKLNPDNIDVAHPEFHRIIDQGTEEDRSLHPEWNFDLYEKRVSEMIAKYDKYKILNNLS
jgi:hypothetical protein